MACLLRGHGFSLILVRVAEARRQKPPAARVRVVWFDIEELGLLGSAKYVESHNAAGPMAMLNFDIRLKGGGVRTDAEPERQAATPVKIVASTCPGAVVDAGSLAGVAFHLVHSRPQRLGGAPHLMSLVCVRSLSRHSPL